MTVTRFGATKAFYYLDIGLLRHSHGDSRFLAYKEDKSSPNQILSAPSENGI